MAAVMAMVIDLFPSNGHATRCQAFSGLESLVFAPPRSDLEIPAAPRWRNRCLGGPASDHVVRKRIDSKQPIKLDQSTRRET